MPGAMGVYEDSTHLLSLAKADSALSIYYRRRPFTTCAVSFLLRQVSVGVRSLVEASDPGGSRNGSTEMRS
jgi:hypothetical protein